MGMLTEAYNRRTAGLTSEERATEEGRQKLRELADDFTALEAAYAAAGLGVKFNLNTADIGNKSPTLRGTLFGRTKEQCPAEDIPFYITTGGRKRDVPGKVPQHFTGFRIQLGYCTETVFTTDTYVTLDALPHHLAEFLNAVETATGVSLENTVSINEKLAAPPKPRARSYSA
ncbi:MAG: hypothetical protein ACAH83_17330 [Alphaproteobacteria bacterium]